ncbi:S-adenosyl-L-methionine-dependent methyltransferase [Xylaria intraflava]|nr:S-adenosyl-L-methionine-dependent methyltransferase [Xylaria intraflava]
MEGSKGKKETEPVVKGPYPIRGNLSPVQETMIATLWSRSHDAASPSPILGDMYAQTILDRIDTSSINPSMFLREKQFHRYFATRGRELDKMCKVFLKTHAHEPVTVVHLACGLDLRVKRLQPWCGGNVRWIDLDMPEAVDFRRRVVPDADVNCEYRLIGASVNEEPWTDMIPRDRPLLVIAEGLLHYIRREDTMALLKRVVDCAPSGVIVLDTIGTLLKSCSALMPLFRGTGVKYKGAVDDGQDLTMAHPHLRLVKTIRFNDLLPGMLASNAPPMLGPLTPLFSLLPSWRTYAQLLQLEF